MSTCLTHTVPAHTFPLALVLLLLVWNNAWCEPPFRSVKILTPNLVKELTESETDGASVLRTPTPEIKGLKLKPAYGSPAPLGMTQVQVERVDVRKPMFSP